MAEPVEITAAPRAMKFDGATVAGLTAGIILFALAVVIGGTPTAFLDAPAFLIVVGGTAAATTVSFSFSDLRRGLSALKDTVITRDRDARDTAYTMLELADVARHHGVLKLQGSPLKALSRETFLHHGLGLVVDGLNESDIASVMREEFAGIETGVLRAVAVIRKAAEFAPAMGLIGTLIGLVQMLGSLGDPSAIGPAMAVALLTTLYGALLANLVLSPLAGKLERNLAEERVIAEIQLAGLLAIARKDNVRKLELHLNGLLPPGQKVEFVETSAA